MNEKLSNLFPVKAYSGDPELRADLLRYNYARYQPDFATDAEKLKQHLQAPDSLSRLRRGTNDPEETLRTASAVFIIENEKDFAIEIASRFLNSSNLVDRYAVASVAGMLGSESIDAKLCELAKADPEIEVRAAACFGLRRVYRRIGIETLLHVAKSEDVDDERGDLSPKDVALDSLGAIVNEPNISLAQGEVSEVVNQAVRFLRTRSP